MRLFDCSHTLFHSIAVSTALLLIGQLSYATPICGRFIADDLAQQK